MNRYTKITGLVKTVLLLTAITLFPFLSINAQSPTHYPSGGDPVEFTFINILVYIVTPIALVFVYLWYRRYISRQKEKEKKK